jgi:hypothetical protein
VAAVEEGETEGREEGEAEGREEGETEGREEGDAEGTEEGEAEGGNEGEAEGTKVGSELGVFVGCLVGKKVVWQTPLQEGQAQIHIGAPVRVQLLQQESQLHLLEARVPSIFSTF